MLYVYLDWAACMQLQACIRMTDPQMLAVGACLATYAHDCWITLRVACVGMAPSCSRA